MLEMVASVIVAVPGLDQQVFGFGKGTKICLLSHLTSGIRVILRFVSRSAMHTQNYKITEELEKVGKSLICELASDHQASQNLLLAVRLASPLEPARSLTASVRAMPSRCVKTTSTS